MAKKVVITTSIALLFLSLFCGICFAEDSMKKDVINFGNGVNNVLDKTGDAVTNMTDNVMHSNVVEKIGNDTKKAKDEIVGGVVNGKNDIERRYNTVRTDAEVTSLDRANRMTNTTWIWMVMIMLAAAISFTVWYYVAQSNERR